MTDFEIIKYVDNGANFYLQFLGNAQHMKYYDNGVYSYIMPKEGEQGIRIIFNIRLENFSPKEQIEKIAEIKTLNMPVWWNLKSSNKLYKLIHGKEKEKVTGELPEGEELYMAIFPNEQVDVKPVNEIVIKKVDSQNGFASWAKFVNDVMNGGYIGIHPQNHYHLCQKGIINCFSCYKNNTLVAVSSIMNNDNISSLEFVATDPAHRREGLAKAVCSEAIKNAFDNGSKIITLRAVNPGTRELYTSLGFRIYNYAL